MIAARGFKEQGAALILALVLLIIMTGLAMTALQLTHTEHRIAGNHREALQALYLAEAGVDEAIGWFTFSDRAPVDSPIWEKMACSGTAKNPDFDSQKVPGFLLAVRDAGWVTRIKLYASMVSKGGCTVESYARSKGQGIGAIAVELGPNPMGPLGAAIAVRGKNPAGDVPVFAHWGKALYSGSVSLGPSLDPIPVQNPGLLPNGFPYGDTGNQDPWVQFMTGELFSAPLPKDCPDCPLPYLTRPNVQQRVSALQVERPDLDAIRTYARRYGEHLTADSNGLLYREGEPLGSFDALFAKKESSGLVFIEPQEGAYPVIRMSQGFYRGFFLVVGDVKVAGNKAGVKVESRSPPWPPGVPEGVRRTVNLDQANLNGLLNVFGDLQVDGRFAVYGAVYADTVSGQAGDLLQVWYNEDYRSDRFEVQPRAYSLPGTWRELDIPIPMS
jgi:hypothetical protein